MTYIIIAIIIPLVGAAAEIVAYVFTDKLLKKREKGLDLREDAIVEAEGELDSREIQVDRREAEIAEREKKLVRVFGRTSFSREDCLRAIEKGTTYAEFRQRWIDAAKYQLLQSLVDRITVFQEENPNGRMIIRAELWVAEGGPDDGKV